MNITRASLFRGLDGFAQSFRQLLVKETREQREARVIQQSLLDDPQREIDPHVETTETNSVLKHEFE